MSKFWYLTATLTIAIASSFPQIALSKPSYPASLNSTFTNPNSNDYVCFIQTTNGKKVNLSSICGKVSPNVCYQQINDVQRQANLMQFCNQNTQCLLNSTCDAVPPPVYIPRQEQPGSPLGFMTPNSFLISLNLVNKK